MFMLDSPASRESPLRGWVRNCPDASVELVAEGPPERREQLLECCRRGPPAARVDACESDVTNASGEFQDFGVRR